MRLSLMRNLSFVFIALIIVSCANRGTPTGGEIDEVPPVILKEVPENFSTNFKGDEITIYFDEYVKIKDLRKQLIISPPMDTDPIVTPMSVASKYISIKIKDTLEANTTYAFNFGESIVDNNEENPYPYYRYVFSTGDTIDSLSVKGFVADALLEEPDTFISVMLYDVDSTYTDSIVYKEKPRYITNTLDSLTSFSIENIKAGTYKLVALKDKNGNYKFDQKADKIGFNESYITVPTDSTYKLTLFNEDIIFKAFKPKQDGEKRLIFPYEGDYKSMRIKVLGDTPEGYQTRIIKDKTTDTLYYWYKPKFEIDTTFFIVSNQKYVDTFKHRFRSLEGDSLKIKAIATGTLNFDQDFTIEANIPLTKIDTSKIKLMDKDSLAVAYTVEYDSIFNRYKFPIEKEEGQKYFFEMLPGTFTDFYEGTNIDTLSYALRTKMKSEYGNLRVNLRNATFPLIVQLVNDKGVVIYEKYTTESTVIDFTDISPRQYGLRVIFDENGNGKYDTGNYLLGIQPERVSYAPSANVPEIRSNFDQVIEFTLLD
ncbi:Ig-like domain-containing protein [Winogradskyella echinorum]|uniref:Ig-like domain-containing protein n=1 Tax=Winogradskyella echinorum TaxID=538189 RepID=A0ABR6XYG5_9FLAO|nr:Ig-like domain-containing protein [Winogradskyella echinorum]MBC3845526.1 Ig-like domain-containing protein [Winogradskyella echinorum]MBC5749874.1 Ig-like domain-containing protein [Winogradskyella echinorum]